MRYLLAALITAASFGQPPELKPAAPSPASEAYTRQWFTIDSKILGENRRITVALPPSFSKAGPGRRFPVGVVFDGEYVLGTVTAVAAELARNGHIPDLVLVSIDNIDDYRTRVRDLTPPGLSVSGSSRNEGGDRFLDFIEKELLPAVDSRFRGSAPRLLLGLSSGGILATWAAATRPAFRLIVALDGPTHLDDHWLPKKLVAAAASRTTPLHFAAFAARFEWTAAWWAKLKSAAPASWRLHYEKLPNETHNSMRMLGAYLGLREVFAPYSRIAAPVFPTTAILPYYDGLTAVFGARMEPPQPLLRELVEDLTMEGRGATAREVYSRLVAAYGEPQGAARLLREIEEAERRPPPAETVESLMSAPFPAAAEGHELIGEWEGAGLIPEMPDMPERRFRLIIRAENGRLQGESVQEPEPGTRLVQKLEYLKLEPDGFTYGYRNGMRPRGMLLYSVRRTGDQWEAEMRWGGVSFRRPDGSPPPVEKVTLRKKGTGPVSR